MYAVHIRCLVLFTLLAAPACGADFPVESLRIEVKIDGRDDLHLAPKKTTWKHKTLSTPDEVLINDFKWDVKTSPELVLPSSAPLLRPDLELCGAVLHVLRGRGSVKLGRDADGLVIHFDDSDDRGPDTYEITVDFAEALAAKPSPSKREADFEWRIKCRIDGLDQLFLHLDQARWEHKEKTPPAGVTINGKPWDTVKDHIWKLPSTLLPEVLDFQKATLSKDAGRGIASLDYMPEKLIVALEDHGGGARDYDVTLKIPRFPKRYLVKIKADLPDALSGAALHIYREGEEYQAWALLAGDRRFDSQGQCFVALGPGKYQFEVQHKLAEHSLVALKTGWINVSGPKNLDLHAQRVEPGLRGPDKLPMPLDELQIRSVWKTGAISWEASPEAGTAPRAVWISQDQSYHVHAFGHAENKYVAIWKEIKPAQFKEITLEKWLTCTFRWKDGTPNARRKGVGLTFPDGRMAISDPEQARFFTNRRFFDRAYWLEFDEGLKAVFQTHGHVLGAVGPSDIILGGPLRPVAAAAILQDERLKNPPGRHLWWDITLADAQNDILDVNASKIKWEPKLTMRDGTAPKIKPLQGEDIQKLGNLKETLTASASFRMETDQTVTVFPEEFVKRETEHCVTHAPAHHDWNTRTYLSKAEREINMISQIIHQPLPEKKNMRIKWWFNTGAVGGGYSVTMPITTYIRSRDWYTHTWAIAHEMLHNFGYGHSHEMNCVDHAVQERMRQFRWYVSDHPEYIPENWGDWPRF